MILKVPLMCVCALQLSVQINVQQCPILGGMSNIREKEGTAYIKEVQYISLQYQLQLNQMPQMTKQDCPALF
jgi:hypothetical protein